MTELPDEATILETAADLIEKHGHIRHAMFNRSGAMCVQGGLEAAVYLLVTGEEPNTQDAGTWLLEQRMDSSRRRLGTGAAVVLSSVIPKCGRGHSLAGWNDYRAKDAQEVLDSLRLAAKKARDLDLDL